MSAASVFPITLHCNDKGWSAYSFRRYFLAAKPKDFSWYGYDTVILSRTEVEFVTYDMRDFCYGGLGKETSRFRAAVSEQATLEAIEERIRDVAVTRRNAELAAAEDTIIRGYADEVRDSLAKVQP